MTTRNIIAFLLAIGISVHGQINTFLKTYSATPGYNTTQYFFSGIDTLSKNSFVSAGAKIRSSLNSADTLVMDGYIQKTEVSGLTKWFRSYHINGYTLGLKDLTVISNKEILVVGHTNDIGNSDGNSKHGIVMKTDSNGYVIWCRLYPKQKIYNVSRRTDGNIAILAADSGSWYGKNLKLALLNSSGNLIWCKRLMTPDSNFYGVHLKEGINKGFLINSNFDTMALLDSNGNHVNDIVYNPRATANGFHNVINYYNQYYYITGLHVNTSTIKLLSTITKTDASLNIIWHKTYQSLGGDSEFQDIVALSPNNLVVFCEPENYGPMPNVQRSGFAFFDSSGVFKRSYLFTTDSLPIIPEEFMHLGNANFLFTAFSPQFQYFGVVDTISGNFCKQTQIGWNNVPASSPVNANYFTCVNATFNYSIVPVYVYQPIDATIEYVCSNGPTGPLDPTYAFVEEQGEESEDIKIFPIPCSSYAFLDFNIKIERNRQVHLKLFNSIGQEIMNDLIPLESKYLPIDLRNFSDGVYYLNVTFDSEKTIIKKIIVVKN